MFAKACEIAASFTKPVVAFMRLFDKSVVCSAGAFVVLNEEGWIVTVAHIFQPMQASKRHIIDKNKYDKQIEAINKDTKLTDKQKRRAFKQIKPNLKWITNLSYFWGWPNVILKDIKILPEGDIAIGRLDPFDKTKVSQYPVIKDNTKGLKPGTSLCRLGFPFHNFEASYDEANNKFVPAPGAFPLPFFVIEGIYSRNIDFGKSKDGKYNIKFIETSSPGLKGQSGGPIYDTEGTIWAIQNQTRNYLLGFSPKLKKDGKEVEENQFLNVGSGVHPDTMVPFLLDSGISIKLSSY